MASKRDGREAKARVGWPNRFLMDIVNWRNNWLSRGMDGYLTIGMGWPMAIDQSWGLVANKMGGQTAGKTVGWTGGIEDQKWVQCAWGMGGPEKLSFNPAFVKINKRETNSRW